MSKPHFNVTAGLIWRDGRLLITKRPRGSHLAGYWEFPGGKQEVGESLEECIEREMMEELGMKVKAAKHLLLLDHEYDEKSISLHLFECSHLGGEPQPIGCDDMTWVKPHDLGLYKLPPPDFRMIPFIRKIAGGS
ncbi:MAG: (deoxy)nucleoside triphosphate pyrophosphohydrolase [Deltaproteobacteria bacterium]|nr:(deoxy)nucleoside triphosphate pyrophosphohydrolase [Deltaproteobacteria bacterium]